MDGLVVVLGLSLLLILLDIHVDPGVTLILLSFLILRNSTEVLVGERPERLLSRINGVQVQLPLFGELVVHLDELSIAVRVNRAEHHFASGRCPRRAIVHKRGECLHFQRLVDGI